jgi:hypothetical protein
LPGGPLRRLRARSADAGGRPTASAARVVRRAPILSDIRVVWHPGEKRWLDPSGLVVTFQAATEVPTAGPRPLLELPSTLPLPRTGTLPALNSKQWTHYHLSIDTFKRLNLWDQMLRIAELANAFPVTPIELAWRDSPREHPTRFYRYHKFPLDPTAQQLVFGGGINKKEITDQWLLDNLKPLIKTRYDLLKQLSSNVPARQVSAMQKFQANAMSTPFIATTNDLAYAQSLYTEYPPTEQQKAVVLVIEGPMSHAFDFEAEFNRIRESGGGRAEWQWRTSADRAKDAGQAEFGLPDLFIPMHGVSPLGFRIVEVIELGIPERAPDLFLNLTTDERLQLVRALSRPKLKGPGSGDGTGDRV